MKKMMKKSKAVSRVVKKPKLVKKGKSVKKPTKKNMAKDKYSSKKDEFQT